MLYSHIQRVKFIQLSVDRYTFNKILAHRLFEFNLEKNADWEQKIIDDNKFIRFKCADWYIDATIQRIITKDCFTILIGDIIDWDKSNKQRVWSEKQKLAHSKNKKPD